MRQFNRFAVGSVLADSLSAFGRYWVTYLPLSLIAFVLFAPIKASFDVVAFKLAPDDIALQRVLDGVVSMLWAAWLGGGLAFGVVNAMRGNHASHWQVVRAAVPIMPRLLIVVLVQFSIVTAAGLLLLILPALAAMAAWEIQLPLLAHQFLLAAPGLVFMVVMHVALPAAAMERVGPLRALSRSWRLTRGWRWQVFGLLVVMFVIWRVVDRLVCLATGACGDPWQAAGALVFSIDFAARILLGALEATVVAVSYYHLVVLKEGSETSAVARVFD